MTLALRVALPWLCNTIEFTCSLLMVLQQNCYLPALEGKTVERLTCGDGTKDERKGSEKDSAVSGHEKTAPETIENWRVAVGSDGAGQ